MPFRKGRGAGKFAVPIAGFGTNDLFGLTTQLLYADLTDGVVRGDAV